MADNITLDSMSGGAVVATDDISDVHYQIIKLAYGPLNTATLVTASVGMPTVLLAGSASIGILGSNSGVDIGDVTINNSTGAAAVNIQDGGNTITVDASNLQSNVNQIGGTNVVTAGVSGMIAVGGNIAHDTADTSNPLKIGGRSQEPTASLEEVADNDRVDAAFDRQGRLAFWLGYPVTSVAVNFASSGNNTILAAQGAGKRIAVMGAFIQSDGTVDFRFEDGADGTAKTGQQPLAVREGFVLPIGSHPWFVGSANTLLNGELSGAINVHGIVSYVVMED